MTAGRDRKYLAAADILRVFAIFIVAWYHIWQQSWLDPGFRLGQHYVNLQQTIRHGYVLVDALLVISGFLLTIPYARAHFGLGAHPSPKEFYVKRFWRIVPSYALAVLLCLVLFALPEGSYSSGRAMVKDIFAHLTFTHNLFFDTYFATPLPIVLWTMGVEVQFYVLFPLIAVVYEARPKLTCLVLAVIAFAVRARVYFMPDTTFWVNQLPCMLDLYACGMLAAYLHARPRKTEPRKGTAWLMAAIAFFALLVLLQIMYLQPTGDYDEMRRWQLLSRLPIGVASGIFLLCGCRAPAGLDRALGNPVTRFLSAVSYNFYIWHQTIAVRLKMAHIPAYTSDSPNMSGEQPWQTRYTLLCFAAALAVAALVTYLWEKPLSKWGMKRYRIKEQREQKEPSAPPA